MKKFYLTLFVAALGLQLVAQKLVSAEYLSTSQASTFPGINAVYDIDNWKIQYNTLDPEGNEHVASGLLCIPSVDVPETFPLACYQHGTVDGREDVPSNLMGGFVLGVAFATNGYVVAVPDFIGLGDSPGVHPYVHAESEASAGVDCLLAAQEFLETLDNVSLNDQLFITGYSQGGHAAMALQQEIETNQSDLFTVTASAPMSGPYSISESMVDFTLGDTEYMTVDYLAWLTLGYNRVYPDLLADFDIDNVFRPEYIPDIIEFRDEVITRSQLNGRMVGLLTANGGQVLPKNTLLDGIADALMNDPTHPLSQALQLNDTYNFVTDTPTNLYYCEGDDQVTFENAILAQERMTDNGSSNVQAIRTDSDVLPSTHTQCVFPAALTALTFFNSLKETPPSSVRNIDFSDHVSITFAEGYLTIIMEEPSVFNANLNIYNGSAQQIHTQQIYSGQTQMLLPTDIPGPYFVSIYTNDRLLNVTQVINP